MYNTYRLKVGEMHVPPPLKTVTTVTTVTL